MGFCKESNRIRPCPLSSNFFRTFQSTQISRLTVQFQEESDNQKMQYEFQHCLSLLQPSVCCICCIKSNKDGKLYGVKNKIVSSVKCHALLRHYTDSKWKIWYWWYLSLALYVSRYNILYMEVYTAFNRKSYSADEGMILFIPTD